MALVLLGLAACSVQRPTGTWRGERDLVVPQDAPPHVANTMRRVEIEFHADGRYTMTDAGIQKAGYVHVLSGQRARLSIDTILEQPWERVMQGEPKPPDILLEFTGDDTALMTDPARSGEEPVLLQRLQP